MIEWLQAEGVDRWLGLALLVAGVLACTAALASARVRRGEKCGAPLRRPEGKHMFCRNPLPDAGGRCAAGHLRIAPVIRLLGGVMLVLGGLALLGVHPLPF